MKHEDENDFFNRLEADLSSDFGGEVVDLDKARAARESADPRPDSDTDASSDAMDDPNAWRSGDASDDGGPTLVDAPGPTGPGVMERVRGARRRPVLPGWATSRPEFVNAAGWLAGYAGHSTAFHAVRLPWYAAVLTARAPVGFAKFVGASCAGSPTPRGPAASGRGPP